mmetsp:Transcript_21193/g.44181  ORF Transcript_21193/g.44181 Transcript_21193/m.44181 type:complete len:86 (+) Transcript_21193:142-399(+)
MVLLSISLSAAVDDCDDCDVEDVDDDEEKSTTCVATGGMMLPWRWLSKRGLVHVKHDAVGADIVMAAAMTARSHRFIGGMIVTDV